MNREVKTPGEISTALVGLTVTRAEPVDFPLTDGLILTGTKDGATLQVKILAPAPWESEADQLSISVEKVQRFT